MLVVLGYTYRDMDDCRNDLSLFELARELDPGSADARKGIECCRLNNDWDRRAGLVTRSFWMGKTAGWPG
jgi:hypothetical protein